MLIKWPLMFYCRTYKNKTTAVDHSVTTQLISSTEPAILTSYLEFDENDENFKLISGSYKRESDDL